MFQDFLTITDSRTQQTYNLRSENGTIRAMDLGETKPPRRFWSHDLRGGFIASNARDPDLAGSV